MAHAILLIAYQLLRRDAVYEDLGVNYFDERDRKRVEQRLARRLQDLGYAVSLNPA